MKIAIVCGSHRQQSQSSKLAMRIRQALLNGRHCDEVFLLDLAGNPLPLWSEDLWSAQSPSLPLLTAASAELAASDALVVVSPEWHGMVPAGLKNFFLLWGRGELAHKPALIVSLSSVDGGAYPVAELRMSSYKNNRLCYLPEHLIVRNVESIFNDNPADNIAAANEYFEQRLDYCLRLLREYALAFRQIRASGAASLDVFKNGM